MARQSKRARLTSLDMWQDSNDDSTHLETHTSTPQPPTSPELPRRRPAVSNMAAPSRPGRLDPRTPTPAPAHTPNVGRYTPSPNNIPENEFVQEFNQDLLVDNSDLSNADQKPIFTLDLFSVFDPEQNFIFRSLSLLVDSSDNSSFYAAGVACPMNHDAGNSGDEEEGDDDEELDDAVSVQLSTIIRTWCEFYPSLQICIETEYAWYYLQQPSVEYRHHYQPFYIPRSLASFIVSMIVQDESIDYTTAKGLLSQSHDHILGRPFNVDEFDSHIEEITLELMETIEANELHNVPLVSFLLKQSGIGSSHLHHSNTRQRGQQSNFQSDKRLLRDDLKDKISVQSEGAVLRYQAMLQEWSKLRSTEAFCQLQKNDEGFQRFRLGKHTYKILDDLVLSDRENKGPSFKGVGFARLVGILNNQTHSLKPLASDLSLLVHHYIHSQQTFLGPIGSAQALFATRKCSVIKASQVIGQCSVLDIKSHELLPEGHAPFHFYCSHFYDHDQGVFEDVQSGFFASHCQNGCQMAKPNTTTPKISFNQQKARFHGQTVHLHDYVRIQSKTGYCDVGKIAGFKASALLVQLFERLDDNFHGTQLVMNPTIVQVAQENILGPCFVRFFIEPPKPPTPHSSGEFHYTGLWWSKKKDPRDPTRPLISPLPAEKEACSICYSSQDNDLPMERKIKNSMASHGPLKVLDLFAGGGGLSHGMSTNQSSSIAQAVEISTHACETLRLNLGEKRESQVVVNASCSTFLQHALECVHGCDCQSIDQLPLPPLASDIDIITFGPPCTSLSKLNRHQHEQSLQAVHNNHIQTGNRNSSFFVALSYVDYLRPEFVVIENVPPIATWKVSATDGAHIDIPNGGLSLIVRCFLEMGYQVRFALLDARHYGAPQRRRRFFLLAARSGSVLPNMPQPTHWFQAKEQLAIMLADGTVVNPLGTADGTTMFQSPNIGDAISDLPEFDWEIQKNPGSHEPEPFLGSKGFSGYHLKVPRNAFQRNARRGEPDDLQHFTEVLPLGVIKRVLSIPVTQNADYLSLEARHQEWQTSAPESARARQGFRKGLYSRLPMHEYFPTLTTNFRPTAKQSKCLHPLQKRIYTIRELARGQTFPDFWEFKSLNDSPADMVRQIGNAVPPVIGIALEKEIIFAKWKSEAGQR
ncbi:S-adenosyl-L-methionine-dependent methyltransferase [Sistotremastrum suecicum HHB10207 ss-3]|uniref:DNA (cytosine-5-)-methyltransferase n=1 Tax=Sistotremastrum suecicum HHB10207 ss-3 TaxID=1314776 RepID=A0A166EZU6_9AGAM|nr:S-adenosyl-L-methionine-dependent methyltransferase [Sistotremastrum suecicum HHB10207 ss-3]